jgi:Flp pilus assembly protein TadG
MATEDARRAERDPQESRRGMTSGAHRAHENQDRVRGQSLVEFTLVIPIIAFIFLGIVDMSRVFTSALVVESAAREAADFGAFNSSRWIGDPGDSSSNHAKTIQGMTQRACVASSKLEDFVGDADSCTNPSVAITLDPNGGPSDNCDQADRPQGPCLVQVDMTYEFDLIVPFGFDFFGQRLGLPAHLTVDRTSIFAMSDFSVDQP